jgi:hypothetical protein
MKQALALALIALLALSIGVSAHAAPHTQAVAALQRRVTWDMRHIRRLQARRGFLHRYIAHLRATSQHPSPQPSASPVADPPTTYAYPDGVLSAAEVAGYLRGAGFPESVIPTMVAIAFRESRFDPNAVNGGGEAVAGGSACGLFQLYECPGPQALDPATNAALAFEKYQASGLAPWGG